MRHWKACHDVLSLCQLDKMFHLLMNVVKDRETLPYHFLFGMNCCALFWQDVGQVL